ncbi:MAG: radical SAM protein [Sulfurimonas sp.]|uniref:B12-binding domain-containing radical SAM protein n=1 Tax=Sulfurimonas sp. TaxID=2022749 RepID=UPI003D0E192B
MKVLIVSFFNEESYGVRSLHANLVANNFDAYMMFFKLTGKYYNLTNDEKHKKSFEGDSNNATEKEINLFVEFIKENNFDVVGFSLVSSHFNMYKRIYEKIKNIKNLTIICGGWQISLNPEESARYADYICIGEGEDAFLEIITKLDNKDSLENINNFWKNENGKIIKNDVRQLTADLSLFPIPVFEHKYAYFIENNKLVNHEPYFDNTRYGTFIGRGCPFKCTYCSNSSMTSIYPTWANPRHRSIEHVKSEMIVLKEKLKNVKSINFYDEVFSPSMDWIREFFTWYEKEINIPFFCFFFPGTCSDEKCEVLAKAGMKGVWIGVQSGSKRVRKEVFKRFYTNSNLLEQCNVFHKYGVNVRYDFILDNPFETFEESLESIYLMLELPQPYSMNLFSLKYFPNTQIAQMAIDAGIITEEDLDDNQEEDKDSYLISKSANSKDDIFINRLALYISYHTSETFDDNFKDKIHKLIYNYKISKDISEIETLVSEKIK